MRLGSEGMRRNSWRAARGVLVALFLTAVALTQAARAEDPLLDEATAFFGQVLHLETGAPALIIAVVRGRDTAVAGFGEVADGSGRAPDGNTLMRIGSITKAFTGQVLASLAADGTVALTDPVSRHLRWGVDIRSRSGRAVRLVDLATHAGGLPREVPHAPGPEGDPFANITQQAFLGWITSKPLLFAPGSAILYSNFGFDLLSAALAQAAGGPYPELLAERVTRPLRMHDTTFAPTEEQRTRLIQGHGFGGERLPDVPTGTTIVGSGGLYSTAEDMTRWLRWHLDRFGQDGAEVRLIDHAAYLPRDGLDVVFGMDESGHMDAMGLGWVVMMPEGDRPLILQKAGGLQGVFSYVAFAPTRGLGVFVAINRFDFAAAMNMAKAANDFIATLAPR
jgi:serine-type D-Ala-D-Ala carboxypeptidase/endopeptidase